MKFYAIYARIRVVFWENLHSWHKIDTTAGRDGRDKSQLCVSGNVELFFSENIINFSELRKLPQRRLAAFIGRQLEVQVKVIDLL